MFSRTAIGTIVLLASPAVLLGAPAWAQQQTASVASPPAPYSRDTPIETLAADPAAAAVLNKDLPGLLGDPQYPVFKRMSLKTIQDASGGDLSSVDVDKTVADLQALPPH
jgi:hypothetical protein